MERADKTEDRGINDELEKNAGDLVLTWHVDICSFSAVILYEADENVSRVLLEALVRQNTG